MKKFIVWMLVLAMMMSCTAAFADENQAVEFELTLNIDIDAIPQDSSAYSVYDEVLGVDGKALFEADLEFGRAAAALMNVFSVHGIVEGQAINVSLNVKDKPIITLNESMDADGQLLLATNLVPSFVFTMSPENMAQSDEQDAAVMAALQEIALPVLQIVMESSEAMNQYIIAEEEGAFVLDGYTYDRRTAIRMTGEEFWAILQHAEQQLIPLVEKLIVAYGMEEDAKAMEDAVADVQEQPLPEVLKDAELTVDMYYCSGKMLIMHEEMHVKNTAHNIYGTISVREDRVVFGGVFGPNAYADRAALEQAAAEQAEDVVKLDGILLLDMENETGSLTAEVISGEGYERHELLGGVKDGKMEIAYRLFMDQDGACVLEVALNAWESDEKAVAVETEGKKIITYDQITAASEDPESEEAEVFYALAMELMTDVEKASNGMVIQLILAAPEEIQAFLDAQAGINNLYLYDIPEKNTPIDLPDEGVSF